MNGGGRPYRDLTPVERNRTRDHYLDLLDAACDARRTGWRTTERDPLYAAARSLGVWVWPTLAIEITREATRLAAAPLNTKNTY
jgi:hypothetical protein